jgi:hypothetical protein
VSSLLRRIAKKGSKIGVHNDVKPVKRAPRGSRRKTKPSSWRSAPNFPIFSNPDGN